MRAAVPRAPGTVPRGATGRLHGCPDRDGRRAVRLRGAAVRRGHGRGRQPLATGRLRGLGVARPLPHRPRRQFGAGRRSRPVDRPRRRPFEPTEQGHRLLGRRQRPRGDPNHSGRPAGRIDRQELAGAIPHHRRGRGPCRHCRRAARRVAGHLSARHGATQSGRGRPPASRQGRAGPIRRAAAGPRGGQAPAAGHAADPRLSPRRRPRQRPVGPRRGNERGCSDHRLRRQLHRGRRRQVRQPRSRPDRRIGRPHGDLDPHPGRAGADHRKNVPGRTGAAGNLHGRQRRLPAGRAGDLCQPHVL